MMKFICIPLFWVMVSLNVALADSLIPHEEKIQFATSVLQKYLTERNMELVDLALAPHAIIGAHQAVRNFVNNQVNRVDNNLCLTHSTQEIERVKIAAKDAEGQIFRAEILLFSSVSTIPNCLERYLKLSLWSENEVKDSLVIADNGLRALQLKSWRNVAIGGALKISFQKEEISSDK